MSALSWKMKKRNFLGVRITPNFKLFDVVLTWVPFSSFNQPLKADDKLPLGVNTLAILLVKSY